MAGEKNPLDEIDKETLRARANLFNLAFLFAVQNAAKHLAETMENPEAEPAIAAELVTQAADALAAWPIAGALEADRPIVMQQLQIIADTFHGSAALARPDPDRLH